MQGVELSPDNKKKLESIDNVTVLDDTYKLELCSVNKRAYCIGYRYAFFYDQVLNKFDADSFLLIDADLWSEKDLSVMLRQFNKSDYDLCTKLKKKSGVFRAFGMQMVKNNETINKFYKEYYDIINSEQRLEQVVWHLGKYKFIDSCVANSALEETGIIDTIKLADFKEFEFSSYIPFMHGKRFRRSESYKEIREKLLSIGMK